MRPFVLFVLLGSALGVQGVTPGTADPASFTVSAAPLVQAPADEYFGEYRLSNLSVRTAIRDMTIEGDSPLALPGQVQRIDAVQSALADWATKYPHDPWLPSTIVRFATFLVSKNQARYDRAALAFLDTLVAQYPGTWYASYARSKIQNFDMLPDFDLTDGPDVRQLPYVFETGFVGIGANRPHRLFAP